MKSEEFFGLTTFSDSNKKIKKNKHLKREKNKINIFEDMKLLTYNFLTSKCIRGVKVGYPLKLNVIYLHLT